MSQTKAVHLIEIHIFCCKHFFLRVIVSEKINDTRIFIVSPLVSVWYLLTLFTNERRHPYPFYRSLRFFTPCKLKRTPTKEGTPTRSFKLAPPQSKFPNFLYQNFGLFFGYFWALLPIFGLQYFFQNIKFFVEGLPWVKPAPPLYKNSDKWKINCIRILGFFGLYTGPKTNFQKPPLYPKKQPPF